MHVVPGSESASPSSSNEKKSNSNRSILSENEGNEPEQTSAGDMLKRVGDARRKVMGLYRLMGNKADVVKGFAKRCTEQWEVAPRSEIGLYLGDIQGELFRTIFGL
jgi:magnesium transporter